MSRLAAGIPRYRALCRWAFLFAGHNAVFTTLLWCTGFLRLLVTSQCSFKLLELQLVVFLVTLKRRLKMFCIPQVGLSTP